MNKTNVTALARLRQVLPDTPENEPVYFLALSRGGRFFLDDPSNPTALAACSSTGRKVCHIRALDADPQKDWAALIEKIAPDGALCGDFKLLRTLASQVGYCAPTEEVVYAQKGKIRLKAPLAEKIRTYSPTVFELVDKNAPWLWDGFPDAGAALKTHPAFAVKNQGRIVAIAMVCSFSYKWAQIAYWVHNDYRLKGLATRCAAALTAYLNQRGYGVVALTDESHALSQSIIRKLGLYEAKRMGFSPKRCAE